ncbi:MAG TPA: hypothetical protein VJX73_11130 [Terracidiphilus sp.]|nr:hypothetical protein [Terracidiphilus sp.]
MPSKSRPGKSLSQCLFSLGVSAAALIAGLSACTSLSAQQAEADEPRPAVMPASTTAAPAPGPAPQAVPAAPQSAGASTPAPQTQLAQSAPGDLTGQQTKRILGIVPNFRAVSTDEKLPPETVKDKFMGATEDSFDYSSIFFPAVIALYNMGERTTPQFHQGGAGYARYFWHSAVDQTSENYWVEFIFPTITREDGRYYTLGRGGFAKRTGYALSRAVITRSNSGNEVFNISEVFGAGASAGISNLYYPSASRSVGNTVSEWGLDVGIDAGTFWFREFWPDINRHVFHNKYGQQ